MTTNSVHYPEPPAVEGVYPRPGPEAALISPNSYFRSKILTVNHGINQLVAACAPIFSIISQCQNLTRDTKLNQLQQELIHEIFSFESVAQNLRCYQDKTLLAARLALCAFIDESIERSLGAYASDWQPFSLLHRFHGNAQGGQQFYVLLERAMGDPKGYIDLLELFYMCLSLGYHGKYADNQPGFLIRENIINQLYNTIRQQRGDFSRSVLVGSEQSPPTTTPRKKRSIGVLVISVFAILSIIGVIASELTTVKNTNASVQQAMFQMLHSTYTRPGSPQSQSR